MGKRGMQSKEAMGVDAQEMLAHQLGHSKQKKFVPTINTSTAAKAKPATETSTAMTAAPAASTALPSGTTGQPALASMAANAIHGRFTDMFKAFQFVDTDRSGYLSRDEIFRALDLWNIPVSAEQVEQLIRSCDFNADGGVSYEEFVDALARDTVAPAAMGKRGLQSKEAMGVDAQEMLAHQLGHSKQKKFTPTIN